MMMRMGRITDQPPGVRRGGVLFPFEVADPLALLLRRLQIPPEAFPVPIDAIFPGVTVEPRPDLPVDTARGADADSFVVAAEQVRDLAFMEQVVGLQTGTISSLQVQAIRDWADLLTSWDVSARGTEISSPVQRFGVRGTFRINDEAVAMLNALVHRPWDAVRTNLLRAGVIDPYRHSSRRPKRRLKDLGPVLWDPRLIVAAELHEQFGFSAHDAWDLAVEWLEQRGFPEPAQFVGRLSQFDLPVTGTSGTTAFRVAREVYDALVGPEGRYVGLIDSRLDDLIRCELVGPMQQLVTQQMEQLQLVPVGRSRESRSTQIRQIGFLVGNRYPARPAADRGTDVSIPLRLCDDIRELVRRWRRSPDDAPVHVLEVAPPRFAGRRVDFLVQPLPGDVVHVWIQEVHHPLEWGARRLLGTCGPRWAEQAMRQALNHGNLLLGSGLYYGPGSSKWLRHRATHSETIGALPSPLQSILEPHVTVPEEEAIMQAIDLAPAAPWERWDGGY